MSAWFQAYGCDLVHPRLLVGAVPRDADDVAVLDRAGVRVVVNLVADEEYGPGDRAVVAAAYGALGVREERAPTEDFGGLSPGLLEHATGLVLVALAADATVYLHCRAGRQRSVATAAGVIARSTGVEPLEAVDAVRARRARAEPLPHQREDLARWWAGRGGGDR